MQFNMSANDPKQTWCLAYEPELTPARLASTPSSVSALPAITTISALTHRLSHERILGNRFQRGGRTGKIANALSAGPASITEEAAVIDWPANPKDGMSDGRMLRQGTNGWTCIPDVPGRPQHDPTCMDETMMKWLMAILAGKKPDIDRVGLSYMLIGEARQGQGATPAKDPSDVKKRFYVGPHVMVVLPDSAKERSAASIRISPITCPTHRSSVPQM
jgi:hypothetical protein